jgi:hypothetical protein
MGHDTDDGSKTNPVKTLAHAIDLATTNGSRVYACGEEFDEAITLPAGTSLFGALDCAHGWAYAAASPTHLVAPADEVALTLAPGAAATTVDDVSIEAADATAAGGSSIAVFANAATAMFERCTLTAGIGATGAAGAAQQDVVTPTMADGVNGGGGCISLSTVVGGDGGMNACGVIVAGGGGGNGTTSGGTPGGDGSPLNTGTPPKDGKGGAAAGAGTCDIGDSGSDGPDGAAGIGAASLGSLMTLGYSAPTATDGASPGTPGQGGGGGGGAGLCSASAGPSGGGGGAGGCGGAAGKAGTSGGSSIGLASLNAQISLNNSTITVAHAGDGGLGGGGQTGGIGGQPGAASGAACGGGKGGKGGNGGPGGGGAGGSSLGIAFHGGVAPTTTNTMIMADAPGTGALGGNANAAAKGADGLTCKTVDLGDASSCAP